MNENIARFMSQNFITQQLKTEGTGSGIITAGT